MRHYFDCQADQNSKNWGAINAWSYTEKSIVMVTRAISDTP